MTEDGDTPADGTQQNDGEADAVASVTIGEETTEYSSLREAMNKAASDSKNSKNNVKVTLLDDVDLSGEEWKAVDVGSITIDGQGHTISNMEINKCFYSTDKHGAGFIWNATGKLNIKNITFDQASINTEFGNIIAVVVGYTYETTVFENVNVTNSEVYGFGKVGTILGMGAAPGVDVTFIDCEATGNTIHAMYDAGGLAGNIQRASNKGEADVEISGCVVDNEFVQADLPSSDFTNTAELNDFVSCESCPIAGKAISGTYVEDNEYYWPAYAEYYCSYGDGSHDCTLKNGEKKLANSEYMVGPAASINGEAYLTLDEAIDAAKDGDEIDLLKDIDLGEERVLIKKSITLDLNGNTITSANTQSTLRFGGNSIVTLKDSVGTGKVENTCSETNDIGIVVSGTDTEAYFESGTVSSDYAIQVQLGATVVINGGKYIGEHSGVVVLKGDSNDVMLEVNDGEIVGKAFGISGNGTHDNTDIVINGGKIVSEQGCAIYHPQVGNLTIGGDAELTGPSGVQFCGAGTLTIEDDAVITATADYTEYPSKPSNQGDGSADDGAALSLISRGSGYQDNGQTMTVNITGGTLKSENNAAIAVYRLGMVNDKWTTNENTILENYLASLTISGGSFAGGEKKGIFEVDSAAKDKVSVSGGTFTHKINDAFLAPGCALFPNADGTYTVEPLNAGNAVAQNGDKFYVSLGDAIQAVGEGETIMVLRDVPNAAGISVKGGKNFTVDFGGHTYTLNGPGAGSTGTETSAFQLLKGSTITFKNGTIRIAEGNTQIKRIIQNYANLTLEDMQFYAQNQLPDESYPLTFNNDNVTFKGNTSIYTTNPAETIAFDVCKFDGYPSANVTFAEDFTGTIAGSIVYDSPDAETHTLTIQGNGCFTEVVPASYTAGADVAAKTAIKISGGHFVSDPSAYVADGHIVVSSDKDGYVYKVVKAPVVEDPEVDVEVEVEVETPKTDVSNIPQDAKEAVEEMAESVKTPELAAAGGDVASKLDAQDVEAAKEALKPDANETVVLTVEPYMDITATDYDEKTGAVTLDIEPKYDLVASIEGTTQKVTLESARPLDVTTPVTVTVTLASEPAGDGTYYVRHVKDSGEIYYYKLTIKTVDGTTTASFVNPNGFSAFTLPLELTPVTINFDSGVGARQYTEKDIGEKFPKAQKDGYTFVGWEIGDDLYTKLTAELWNEIKGEDSVNAVAKFKKSSSGGGAHHPEAGDGSSSKRYDISKPSDVENGSIKVSDSKAEKGETITITVTPDEGYALDKLTVTDEDGDEIDLKDKGDGKFTFEMPKSDVEIEVSFAAVSEVSFADVAPEAWYAEAVQYVVAHGMMNGTSAATFSPDASTTRGMIVTILYRLEGEPAVSAPASFADVAADQYYADAVAWAAQNGIVSGMSADTFAPNNAITREQMAAILYRYAQFKGYDTAQGGMAIREYSDYEQISAYAQQAMAWANASGLITGTSATTLTPAGTATRAQVAAILMRFCENIAK